MVPAKATVVWSIPQASGSGTIYIRSDGSVDPPTAPIQRRGIRYIFTDNIYEPIVIQRDHIVVDGNGYTLQGSGSGAGFTLSSVNHVTIKNTKTKFWGMGISLSRSSYNKISGNTITHNADDGGYGIWIVSASDHNEISGNRITNNGGGILINRSLKNKISRNTITNNGGDGIDLDVHSDQNEISGNRITNNGISGVYLASASYNKITGNTITNNGLSGIHLHCSSKNKISENTITNNRMGIYLEEPPYDNVIYHNNFIGNSQQVYIKTPGYANVWDNGWPSGGNYWSDYTGVDVMKGKNQDKPGSDGIGDTPYVINAYNQDRYPLMKPYKKGR